MNENIKRLCLSSMFAALTFAVTRFIQIPIPLGYLNFGNCIILLGCCFLPCRYAAAAGALGSALADLTSFPIYTVPTLIIKAVMPLAFFALLKVPVKNNSYIRRCFTRHSKTTSFKNGFGKQPAFLHW